MEQPGKYLLFCANQGAAFIYVNDQCVAYAEDDWDNARVYYEAELKQGDEVELKGMGWSMTRVGRSDAET